MNDKDARDMHRLAVGAGEAPTDAQIDAAAKTIAECMDYPWAHMPEKGRESMREHAAKVIAAVLALSPPAIPEVVKEPSDCPNCFEGKSDMQHTCQKCNGTGCTTTPPPAPSSPAPVAGEPHTYVIPKSVANAFTGKEREAWEHGFRWACSIVQPKTAAPSTVQGLSDAQIKAIFTELWRSHSISVTDGEFRTIARAILAILANPAAPSPESGS